MGKGWLGVGFFLFFCIDRGLGSSTALDSSGSKRHQQIWPPSRYACFNIDSGRDGSAGERVRDEPAACSRAAGGPPVARVRPSGRRPSTDVQDRARARRGGLQVRRARLTRHGPASSAQLAVGHTTNARPNATTNYYGRYTDARSWRALRAPLGSIRGWQNGSRNATVVREQCHCVEGVYK